MTRSIKVDSSFLSFPLDTKSSSKSQSVKPKPSPTTPKQPARRRPNPIDLYDLPTLEALPTPASSSNGNAPSIDSHSIQTLPANSSGIATFSKRAPRRLRKPTSFGDMQGTFGEMEKKSIISGFGIGLGVGRMRRKEKNGAEAKAESIKQASSISFLPMDEDVKAPSINPAQTSVPITRSRLPRPHPGELDPSIFGREVKVVIGEDPIEQVIRMQKDEDKQALERSFQPDWNEGRSVSRQRGQTIGHRPATAPLNTTSRTNAGGSTRQRNHAPMPSIQGVIQGDSPELEDMDRRRGSRQFTNTRPAPTPPTPGPGNFRMTSHIRGAGDGRAESIRSFNSDRHPPLSPPSSPIREFLYPDPTPQPAPIPAPVVSLHVPSGRPPTYYSNKDNTSPIRPVWSPVPSLDASPTLGSAPLPRATRHLSLTPSTISQTEHAWRSSRHVEPDEERLTALEILEELNGDMNMEDGWEFDTLAKQRLKAGLVDDYKSSRRYGMASPPPFPLSGGVGSTPASVTVVEREGSIKDVRSWRETRKRSKDSLSFHRPASVKSKTKSLKPKPSIEGLEPLYEVSYTIEPDIANQQSSPSPRRPPIPPRSANRSAGTHLRLEIQRGNSGNSVNSGSGVSAMEVPLLLDSPVKETRRSVQMVKVDDTPHSVKMSPAILPTPLHLRPLPPLPESHSLHHSQTTKTINPLTSLKQSEGLNRLLRPKRASSSSRPSTSPQQPQPHLGHRSSPPAFSAPQSPLDAHPPSSPRPRLSARDEPHAGLPARPSFEGSFGIDRAKSRKHGMTALSFLALDDPSLSYSRANTESTSNRNSIDVGSIAAAGRRRESVQAHIIPPEELSKLYHRRRSSSTSDSGMTRSLSRAGAGPTEILLSKDEIELIEHDHQHLPGHRQLARTSFGLSPPPPPRHKHNRRSFEPPPRDDDEDYDTVPISLSPPPRPRNSLNARRPTPSPVHIDTALGPHYTYDSYIDFSPSPSPLDPTPITPANERRRGSASSRTGAGHENGNGHGHGHGNREGGLPPRDEFNQYSMRLIGHASELVHGQGKGYAHGQIGQTDKDMGSRGAEAEADGEAAEREAERQALNDWLALPRSRKASIPVNRISRIRPGVYV